MGRKLIAKGEATNNPKLIEMGRKMLNKDNPVQPSRPTVDDFTTTMRNPQQQSEAERIQRDEDGNVIKTLTKAEPISPKGNTFVDEKDQFEDLQNEKLKQFTVRTPRRPPAAKQKAKCVNCGAVEEISKFLPVTHSHKCVKCLRKMSG